MGFTRDSAFIAVWCFLLLGMCASTIGATTEQGWLRSNVFELLPQANYDPLVELATKAAERELSSRLTFLIGAPDGKTARTAAAAFAEGLSRHSLIARVESRIDESRVADFAGFYFPYRRGMLTEAQIASIGSDAGEAVEQAALAALYSPMSTVSGASLLSDPFFLFPESMQSMQPGGRALQLVDNYLSLTHEGMHYVFVAATTVSASLAIGEQEQLVGHIDALIETAIEAGGAREVLETGFLFYSNAGTQDAKNEISIIGTGSLFGILILVLVTFRSPRPLYFGLLSVGGGCIVAVAVTIWTFGSVHVMTLVFGATLIGVSIDYTFHYLAEEAFGDDDWTPREGLRRVLPGMTLGLITSVTAFLALSAAPFPGLKQLAVFASAGLIGAYVTLLCCALSSRAVLKRPNGSILLRLSTRYLAMWNAFAPRRRVAIGGSVAVCALLGVFTLQFHDDISILQDQPVELKRQEEKIVSLLSAVPSNVFLLTRGDSTESLLQNEESARAVLDTLVAAGGLSGYQAVSRSVPSRARQARSFGAYATLTGERLAGYYARLGVDDEASSAARDSFGARAELLTVEDWLKDPVSQELRGLWLGETEHGTASMVLLEGVRDPDELRRALQDEPAVTVVHKAQDLSDLLTAYRVRATWLFAAALLVVIACFGLRFGLRRALVLLTPPLLAGLIALVTLSAAGAPLNIFNLLAMVLVFGIGIDATLFIVEAEGPLEPTMFAITLSAATTMLSFGLLALSSTYAVQSFGLTVLIGITCSYLLAPLALSARSHGPPIEQGC